MGGSELAVAREPGRDVFALTDEQILGMEPEGTSSGADGARELNTEAGDKSGNSDRGHGEERGDVAEGLTPEGASYMEPPSWLAREMKDPWVGEEAREFWEGVQRAEREAGEYRAAFGSAEEARELKEIYPGGVAEAKSTAERARTLAEIDAAYFGVAGKPAEELSAARGQLVEKLYAQDPAAFREMVAAGVKILEGRGAGNAAAQSQAGDSVQPARDSFTARGGQEDKAPVIAAYREFERNTNAELEKSVGLVIGRTLEEALPNLKMIHGSAGDRTGAQHVVPLRERLGASVREEVEAALRSDAQLGEQVARILSGQRFDETARAQVVRLIDARAQQLVPGAVRRVVSGWTQATLGTRERSEKVSVGNLEKSVGSVGAGVKSKRVDGSRGADGNSRGRNSRVDYRKVSDEQILEM
jgi:hypothetical protein